MDKTANVALIAEATGLGGARLADELVRRGLALDREDALLIVNVEAGGSGDVDEL